MDLLVALLRESDRVDQLVHAAPAFARRQAVELAEHPELLPDVQQAVAGLLTASDHVHDPPDLSGIGRDVEAEHPRRSAAGQQQRGEDLDERRLAGAVRPEQPEELARTDLEVDSVERDDILWLRPVDPTDAACLDRGRDAGGHETARLEGLAGPESLPAGGFDWKMVIERVGDSNQTRHGQMAPTQIPGAKVSQALDGALAVSGQSPGRRPALLRRGHC